MKKFLGTFWTKFYTRGPMHTVLEGREYVEQQINTSTEELKNCLSIETTPLYKHILCKKLEIYKGKFDGTVQLDNRTISIDRITDRIKNPKITMFTGKHFEVKDDRLHFLTDPFTLFTSEPVYKGDNIVDSKLTLWLRDINIDELFLYRCWGWLIGERQPSSEEYRNLILSHFIRLASDAYSCRT